MKTATNADGGIRWRVMIGINLSLNIEDDSKSEGLGWRMIM